MSSSMAILRVTTSFILLLSSLTLCMGTRRLASLYTLPQTVLKYHNGELLEGDVPVSVVWYGKFTPAQKAIVSDFILSLSPQQQNLGVSSTAPTVSQWWKTLEKYTQMAGKKESTRLLLSEQVSDDKYSLGRTLTRSQVSELAAKVGSRKAGMALVLTDKDVAMEGFCMSSCGFHGSNSGEKWVYVWVGNSEAQCPGQCAWPFHQPVYGPQLPPLVAPSGQVGLDGMVINIASMLASAVTNPFGRGYFQGPEGAPLEAASACTGMYGSGAYPGYAGKVLVDPSTGASYNALGLNGRKFLLPAVFDLLTSSCSTLV